MIESEISNLEGKKLKNKKRERDLYWHSIMSHNLFIEIPEIKELSEIYLLRMDQTIILFLYPRFFLSFMGSCMMKLVYRGDH